MKTAADKRLLIGLDLGTSSSKGVLMDLNGGILATASQKTRYSHPRDGFVEASPEDCRNGAFSVIRELAGKAEDRPAAALAFASAAGNALLLDSDGNPLSNFISWLDKRAKLEPPKLLASLAPEELRRIAGWPCADSFPLAQLAWLREKQPETLRKAARVCMDSDYLCFQLTGEWALDHSTAATSHLQNQLKRKWHAPFLEMLGLDEGKLSRLLPSGALVGKLAPEAASTTGLSTETALVSGCFDHPAAALAAGALEEGRLLLSCGTSWVCFFPERERERIMDLKLLCDPFLSSKGGPWGAILSVPQIGRNIDLYIESFIAPGESDKMRVFNEAAAEASPGAGGLLIDPREEPRAAKASRANLSRALMEGAARLLKERLDALRSQGMRFSRAAMSGGPTGSSLWTSIIAEACGLELASASPYAGAKGAAMLAGIGIGVYKDACDAYFRAGGGQWA